MTVSSSCLKRYGHNTSRSTNDRPRPGMTYLLFLVLIVLVVLVVRWLVF